MPRTEECARHSSCDCVHVEQVLEEAEEDEVLPAVKHIEGDLRTGGHVIEQLGPLFEGYAHTLHRLADDLEELRAHLSGQRRFRVRVVCGTVFAEDAEEAIRKAETADCRTTDYETQVEHRPLVEPTGASRGAPDPSSR